MPAVFFYFRPAFQKLDIMEPPNQTEETVFKKIMAEYLLAFCYLILYSYNYI
jgi:hypothetical protein